MRATFARLCIKCLSKLFQVAVEMILQALISFAVKSFWNWNQTRRVQEMRHAGEGIELLGVEPTPLQMQNAMKKFEKIRTIAQNWNKPVEKDYKKSNVQLTNASSPQAIRTKPPQFKPPYLHRYTRFQVLTGRKTSSIS